MIRLRIQSDTSKSEKSPGDQEREVRILQTNAAKREDHDKVEEMSANISATAPSDFKPSAVDRCVAIRCSNTAAEKITFLTAYRYATKQDLFLLTVSALCAIIGGGLVPVMPLVFSQLASQFLSYDPSTSIRADFSRSTSKFTLYFVYLAVAQFVAIYGATVGFIYLGESISRKIREQYLAALLRQELAFFDHHGVGECTTRLTSDIDRIQNGIGEKFSLTLTAISTFVSAFIIGLVLCWQIMLLISWSVIASVLTMMVGSQLSRKYRSQALDLSSRANSIVEESVSSIRDVVALAAQSRLLDCYERFLGEAESAARHLKVLLGCVLGITVGVNYLNIMIALWFGSFFLIKGDIPYTSVITIQLVITNAIFALMGISGNVEAFLTATAAAIKVFRTIDRLSSLDGTSTLGLNLSEVNGVIELRRVSHAYSSRSDVKVLDDVSIVFPAGKTTALVGESGSGKSTVAALLERFYDPCEGTVLLDGHDVRTLNLRWLRQQIGLVDQQSSLFDGTIFENIGYGLMRMELENMTTEQRRSLIEQAAVTANAHSFILELPDGYNTRVGPRGHMLSGGQKQRISIARAIASNPKILLLDEATSALDAESEERVSVALRAAAAGRTTIVIAHRLSTIKSADNIIVLSRGRLIEQGTHEELIRLGGAYHQSVEAQEIDEKIRKRSKTNLTPVSQENSASPKNEVSGNKEVASMNSPPPVAFPQEHTEVKDHSNYSVWTLVKFVAGFNRKEKGIIAIGLLCCIIAGGEESVHAILFAESTISLALPRSMTQLLRHQIEKWSLLYLALALVQMLAFCGQAIAFAWCSERLLRHARSETFRTIMRQEVSFFDESNHSAGGLTTFLSTETLNLAGLSGSTLGILLIFGTTLVSAILIALAFGWRLALVCMVTIPVLLAAGYLRLSMMGKFHRRSKKAYQDSASYASAAISEIRTVASLSLEGHVWKHYHSSLLAQAVKIANGAIKTSALYALSRSVSFLCMALGFWYGSKLLVLGQYSPFQFFVVYASIILSAKSAGMVFSFAADIGKGKHAAIELKQLFDRTPEIDTWSKAGLHLSDVAGEVEFKDVYFSYPARGGEQVLGGLSFLIKPGEHIAIIGSSGSGKSTIMALLERFYEPTSGQILLDAKPISTLNINSYRSFIALVSQHVALFDGTIKDNLLLGVDEHQVTQEDIIIACQNANILDFIISLPDGFQTLIGPRGCMLSGGQRQRISIARALLRRSRILLLDEAMSALDSESEGLIQQALDQAAQDRTTITIAHRLSTVQKADRIYVMEGGKFVETGSHEDLLEIRGRYWDLVMLQNISSV